VLIAAALLSAGSAAWADDLRVVPLVRDGHVLVSCELSDGFTDEVRAVIQSGLQTTFTYRVELRLKVPAWVDRTVASAVVSATVEYDSLTRRHTVTRTRDGRVEESRVIEDEADVRQWLTTFDRLPLFSTAKLEPNREYYLLVSAKARPRNAPNFWPFDATPAGSAKFTFIP
jgi:hypothetical protein